MDVRLVCRQCGVATDLDAESMADTHRPACLRCGGRLRRVDGQDEREEAAGAPAVTTATTRRARRGAQGRPPVEEPEPFDAEGFLWRAREREQGGDLAGALADCEAALDLEPGLAPVWLLRGALRDRRGDAAGAAADLERFLALAPDHPQAARARQKLEALRGVGGR